MRFGRVPKKEKARIIEQMQKVNSQSQTNALNTMLQNETDVVHAVINAHHITCDLSLLRVAQMRDHALQLNNYINCPANMVSLSVFLFVYYICLCKDTEVVHAVINAHSLTCVFHCCAWLRMRDQLCYAALLW